MYSVVLAMALSGGGADVQAFGHRCHGCDGCWGCSGCYGCSGCWGGGCHGGCHGCHGGGLLGGLFHRHGCHGCHGCSGCSGYYGCHGGWGCSGYYGCSGGWGCSGAVYGCSGGWGCSGGYGCWGGGGCFGYPSGGVIMGPAPTGTGTKPAETTPQPKTKEGGKASIAAPATIIVSLPAEAKLTIDGAPTRSTSATRVFASPALEPGKEYFYILKADLVQDGKTVSTTKRVEVRAGDETRVTLDFADPAVAQR